MKGLINANKQNKVRGKSIIRQLRDETEAFLSTKSFGTQKNYRKWLDAYIKYCREHHNCKTHDECFMHIQDYADYHHIRAENAKRCYDYYLNKINTEEGYAEKLADEIRLRWKLYCTKRLKDGTIVHKPFDEKLIKGTYKARGKNKKLAIKYGFATEYNNLALAAVSIFHLAHWRNNVTVQSYLLSH